MEKVYVPKTAEEKAMQRALLQYFRPQNREIVRKALIKAGRRDLIGVLIPADTNSVRKGDSDWQKNQRKQNQKPKKKVNRNRQK